MGVRHESKANSRRLALAGTLFAAAILFVTAPVQATAAKPKAIPAPSVKTGTYIARILIGTPVRRTPESPRRLWSASTRTRWSGASQKLMVLRSRVVDGEVWLKVRLPIRPNGLAGWIPRDRVALSHTRSYVVVDTSNRLLLIFSRGRVLDRFRVVVGAPVTPTPVGLFAIYDRVKQRDPNGFVGPWVLPLTAHSQQLHRYDGGPGLVAFHGRDGASLQDPLGTARSHGCIRMNNARIRQLMKLPVGTAVMIQR